MSPIRERFEDLGVPAHLVTPWFAGLLRDGFVLTITGDNPKFADLAAASLRTTLHGLPGAGAHDMDAAVRHVHGRVHGPATAPRRPRRACGRWPTAASGWSP